MNENSKWLTKIQGPAVYPSISSYRYKYMIGKSSVIAMSYNAGPYG